MNNSNPAKRTSSRVGHALRATSPVQSFVLPNHLTQSSNPRGAVSEVTRQSSRGAAGLPVGNALPEVATDATRQEFTHEVDPTANPNMVAVMEEVRALRVELAQQITATHH